MLHVFLGWLLGSLAASGLDSGFLAASGLDSVLVAASGLDSGFLGVSGLDSGLLTFPELRLASWGVLRWILTFWSILG